LGSHLDCKRAATHNKIIPYREWLLIIEIWEQHLPLKKQKDERHFRAHTNLVRVHPVVEFDQSKAETTIIAMADNDTSTRENVWQGLLPKAETQALEFVTKNPNW
jgi:hypothetical protein